MSQRLKPLLVMQNPPSRVKKISVREGGLRNMSDDFNRAKLDRAMSDRLNWDYIDIDR